MTTEEMSTRVPTNCLVCFVNLQLCFPYKDLIPFVKNSIEDTAREIEKLFSLTLIFKFVDKKPVKVNYGTTKGHLLTLAKHVNFRARAKF